MARPIRRLDPRFAFTDADGRTICVVEVVFSVIARMFLMCPSEELRALFYGALGYAQLKVPGVRLFEWHALSNHGSLLLGAEQIEAISAFMMHFLSRLSKELKHFRGYHGETVFPRRFRMIQIADAAALIERILYSRGNSVKEGLVACADEWTGPHAASHFALGEIPRGVYHAFAAYHAACRREAVPPPLSDFAVPVEVRVDRAPVFTHLTESEHRAEQRRLTREAAVRYAVEGPVVGAAACEAADPFHVPGGPDPRTPMPVRLHGTQPQRRAFGELDRAVTDAYRAVARRMRDWMFEARRMAGASLAALRALAERHRVHELTLPPGTMPPGWWHPRALGDLCDLVTAGPGDHLPAPAS